jgi:hypothetical protein
MRSRNPRQYAYYYEEFRSSIGDHVTSMLRGLRMFVNGEENTLQHTEPIAECVKRIVGIYQIAAAQSGVSPLLWPYYRAIVASTDEISKADSNHTSSQTLLESDRVVQDVRKIWKWAANSCRGDKEKEPNTPRRMIDVITPLRTALGDSAVMVGGAGTVTEVTEPFDLNDPCSQSPVPPLSSASRSTAYSQEAHTARTVSLVVARHHSQASISDDLTINLPSSIQLDDQSAARNVQVSAFTS